MHYYKVYLDVKGHILSQRIHSEYPLNATEAGWEAAIQFSKDSEWLGSKAELKDITPLGFERKGIA